MISSEFDKILGESDPFDVFTFICQSVVLSTGSTLITNIASMNNEYYVLMLPMILTSKLDGQNVTRVLIPFNPGSEDIFMPIRKTSVLVSSQPEVKLQEFYEGTVEEIMNDVTEEEVVEVKKAINKKLH